MPKIAKEMARVSIAKDDCPTCKAKGSFTVYADGGGICGKCKWVRKGEVALGSREQIANPKPSEDVRLVRPDELSWGRLDVARLNPDTLKKFGYFTGVHRGRRVQVAPMYDTEGTIVAQQLQLPDGTRETIHGSGNFVRNEEMWLFGRHTFGDRYDRKVVVTVTPKDAMAVAQTAMFRYAAVSLISGQDRAERDLKANYRWLDRFSEIILLFDNTPEGLQKAQECARIFPVGKVKIAKVDAYTGPAEALKEGKPGDIDSAVWSAATWRPAGIVNAKETRALFEKDGLLVPQWPYPFKQLQDRTRGMRPGEVTYHVGGTGASKTTILYQLAVHLATLPKEPPTTRDKTLPPQLPRPKIGWLGFEDTTRSVVVGLLSAHANQRLAIYPLPPEEIVKMHDHLFGDGGIELYDPEQAEFGTDAIMGYIDYMCRALGVEVVFVDPLSFVIAGMDAQENERRAIDKAAQVLAHKAKNMGVHLHVSYHLNRPDGTPHEEGGRITLNNIKGSGGLAHFASNVIAYERDQQGERPDLMRVPLLKVRLTGFTGSNWGNYKDHMILQYGETSGVYTESDEEWPLSEENKDSKGSGRKGPTRSKQSGGPDY